MVVLLFIAAIFAFLCYYVWSYYRWVAKYPKGPTPLPFIGNVLQLSSHVVFRDFERFARKHGNVFTVFLPSPIVVISDYDAMREAYVIKGDDFYGRPNDLLVDLLSFSKNSGVINSNGQNWREQRRTSLQIFRDFGMGKNLMEEKVRISVEEYLTFLDNIKDKNRVDLRWPIQTMVSNVINETLFGFRYKYDDCQELMDFVEQFNKDVEITVIDPSMGITYVCTQNRYATTYLQGITDAIWVHFAIRFPLLTKIPYIGYYLYGKYVANLQKMKDHIIRQTTRVAESYEADLEPNCFVHAYMQRMPHNTYLTTEELQACCFDFFLAGQESTTNTLRWAMLYMAQHQDVQDRVRSEIAQSVGSASRLPSMSDRPRMPYTTATLLEIQRYANIFGFNVFHRTVMDTELDGKSIPANTLVNGDIHMILANDALFESPEEFNPQRFLSADGSSINKEVADHCIPFSIGKRQCAGEALARVELFLGFTAMLQRYHILPPIDGSLNLEPIYNTIHMPHANLLQLIPLEQ